MGCLRTLSTCRNVDTESFATPSDSNWSVRFQETGDPFAELAHADFDRSHGDAPQRKCTPMCTHTQACQDSRDSRVAGQLREAGRRPAYLIDFNSVDCGGWLGAIEFAIRESRI